MRVSDRVDRFQRRHHWVGFPLAVVYKVTDDQGAYLAALMTYYGFVSLFPLLLVFVSVVGFILAGDTGLQNSLLHSALADFPVIGDEIQQNLHHFQGSGAGLAIGVVGTLYGGLGLTQAAQNAFNRIYAVPRNERPNPLTSRLRSLGLLALLGTGVVVTTGLSVLSTTGGLASLGVGGLSVPVLVLSVLVNIGLFLAAFQLLTARSLATREVLVGGVLAAVAWQVLQVAGGHFLRTRLEHASAVYGVFGLVLGTIFWIYLECLIVVVCAEVNVVLGDRLWPRALLTPFTDAVDLTESDRRAYTAYANSERFKGFERVRVHFDDPPDGSAAPAPSAAPAGEAGRSTGERS